MCVCKYIKLKTINNDIRECVTVILMKPMDEFFVGVWKSHRKRWWEASRKNRMDRYVNKTTNKHIIISIIILLLSLLLSSLYFLLLRTNFLFFLQKIIIIIIIYIYIKMS